MARLKVALGNDVNLSKRLLTFDGTNYIDILASQIAGLAVKIGTGTKETATTIQHTSSGSYVYFTITTTQIPKVGRYNIWITGTYSSNNVAINMESAIEVVPFSENANAKEYIHRETIDIGDDIFIPAVLNNAEIAQLKAQLEAAISAEQAAKAAYEAKVAMLEGVAQQGSNASATNTAIYSAVQGIVIPTGLATEANATANKNAILAAMPSEATLKPLYAARAEANNDGTDTYTIVFPYTAQVVETSTDITITV